MKTRIDRYILMAVCAVLASTGCEREIDMPSEQGILTVRIADEYVTTRTSYSNFVGKFQWDEGDEIIVPYADDRTKVFCITPGTDPATGTILSSTKGTGFREFYAVFPASAWVDNPTLQIKLPDNYDVSSYVADGNIEKALVPMVAVNDPATTTLDFHHVGGLLRLTCKDVPAGTKKVKVTFDSKVTGTFTVNEETPAEPFIETAPSSTNNSVLFTVTASDGLEEKVPSIVLNIPLPCGTYEAFSLEALNKDGNTLFFRSHTAPSLVFERAHGKRLTISEITQSFELSGEIETQQTVDYTGGLITIATGVISYKMVDDNILPESFHLEYSPNGEDDSWSTTPPYWLELGADVDLQGGLNGVDITLSALHCKNDEPLNKNGVPKDTHTEKLQGRQYQTKDLSLINVATNEPIERSTANCYVVNAPGTYTFPMVYGNAILMNEVNDKAFCDNYVDELVSWETRSEQGDILSSFGIRLYHFKDHMSHNITSPYIGQNLADYSEEEGISNIFSNPQAKLLWMDAPGLIDPATVQFNDGGTTDIYDDDYISFEIISDNICQGNALIGILDNNGVIAWSWHIWVTDADLTLKNTGLAETTDHAYEYCAYNIGWCDKRIDASYPEQQCYVRFVQDDPNGSVEGPVLIKMSEGPTIIRMGNNPYFQGGRKDPMMAWSGLESNPKEYYPAKEENPYYPQTGITLSSEPPFGIYIQNPHLHYSTIKRINNGWNSDDIPNNKNRGSGRAGVKTIYDPSPVGYKVPYNTVYGYVTGTMIIEEDENRLKCKDNYVGSVAPDGKDQFFPIIGLIDSYGSLSMIGEECHYYYASCGEFGGDYVGSRFTLSKSRVTGIESVLHHGAGMKQAMSVRPSVDHQVIPIPISTPDTDPETP